MFIENLAQHIVYQAREFSHELVPFAGPHSAQPTRVTPAWVADANYQVERVVSCKALDSEFVPKVSSC